MVIGSDIPDIDKALLREAFARLDDSDAVVGPSDDGGYYLLGLRRWANDVFKEIPWSTDTTRQVQLQRIRECGMTATELRSLPDVDNPDDFAAWERVSGNSASFYRRNNDSDRPT